jgi:hypothetical protein
MPSLEAPSVLAAEANMPTTEIPTYRTALFHIMQIGILPKASV